MRLMASLRMGECLHNIKVNVCYFPAVKRKIGITSSLNNLSLTPKTLQAFDRVLVRDTSTGPWRCEFFSHIKKDSSTYPYLGVGAAYIYCITYNDDTKHLVGTSEEAPDYYKY